MKYDTSDFFQTYFEKKWHTVGGFNKSYIASTVEARNKIE
jgi:hypothetical protein